MIRLYMDEHVPGSVTRGLRLRGVDVLTAQEDAAEEMPDPWLLDRATELDRLLFSRDVDLLAEATRRQRANETFAGVVYAHQLEVTIGRCIEDLELIAKVCDPQELANQVRYCVVH
jgi:predicted nuclease of predicted toxin-antitoxin system